MHFCHDRCSDHIRFGPFIGAYPNLNTHFAEAGLDPDDNHWFVLDIGPDCNLSVQTTHTSLYHLASLNIYSTLLEALMFPIANIRRNVFDFTEDDGALRKWDSTGKHWCQIPVSLCTYTNGNTATKDVVHM